MRHDVPTSELEWNLNIDSIWPVTLKKVFLILSDVCRNFSNAKDVVAELSLLLNFSCERELRKAAWRPVKLRQNKTCELQQQSATTSVRN